MDTAQDKLIVALDVDSQEEAESIIDELTNVIYFKVGLEFTTYGNIPALQKCIRKTRDKGGVFLDLKVSGDIDTTLKRFVRACMKYDIKFVTVWDSILTGIYPRIVSELAQAKRGQEYPKILGVPILSSRILGEVYNVKSFVLTRGKVLLNEGCDGLIVSGKLIKDCHEAFPGRLLVCPGIRPVRSESDDHVRQTTAFEAIEYGASHLIVGRPITQAENKRLAAENILDNIRVSLATLD